MFDHSSFSLQAVRNSPFKSLFNCRFRNIWVRNLWSRILGPDFLKCDGSSLSLSICWASRVVFTFAVGCTAPLSCCWIYHPRNHFQNANIKRFNSTGNLNIIIIICYYINQYVSSPVAPSKAANTAMIQIANPNFDVFHGCTRDLLRFIGFGTPKWFSVPISVAQTQPVSRFLELKMNWNSGIEGRSIETIDKILPEITSRRENFTSHWIFWIRNFSWTLDRLYISMYFVSRERKFIEIYWGRKEKVSRTELSSFYIGIEWTHGCNEAIKSYVGICIPSEESVFCFVLGFW